MGTVENWEILFHYAMINSACENADPRVPDFFFFLEKTEIWIYTKFLTVKVLEINPNIS